jgi:Asp-tRNA(Asn)/Glu-tRNA(Gln) amidotransferase A subunit family amidase
MYGKIFASMYDGSLYGQWEAIVTMQQMIVLCDAGGVVDMTPQAMAARTSIPLEIIEKGLELLMKPDRYSRTPGCDGRRIELIDDNRPWGWIIVNYDKYRWLASAEEKREADRIRIAEKRAKSKVSQDVAECRNESQDVAKVANVAQAEVEAIRKKIYVASPRSELHRAIIDAYHEILPNLPAVKTWPERRARKLDARISERVREGKPANLVAYWAGYFRKVAASDFLCGRSKSDWRCQGLEWLLEAKNFEKVIEGGFDNVRAA